MGLKGKLIRKESVGLLISHIPQLTMLALSYNLKQVTLEKETFWKINIFSLSHAVKILRMDSGSHHVY